jgi:hypothetical protein
MANPKYMNLGEYARHRGCTIGAIQKGIKDGRISAKKVGSQWRIDVAVADSELRETDVDADSDGVHEDDDIPSYAKSRAKKEAYLAKLKQLEYEQAKGRLVDSEDVRRDAYEVGKVTQTKIMAVAIRIAPQLAGMEDVQEIKRLIEDELRYALEDLTRGK